jgi:hypothetical protein
MLGLSASYSHTKDLMNDDWEASQFESVLFHTAGLSHAASATKSLTSIMMLASLSDLAPSQSFS